MRTVLIVSNTAQNIYHYRRAVWQDLLRRGYRVVAVAAPDAYVDDLEADGIACHALPLLSSYGYTPLSAYRLYRQLKALYKKYQPAVILHFTIRANTIGSLAAGHSHIPSIATITGLGSTWLRSPFSRGLVSLLYRWTLPSASIVITQNGSDQPDLVAAGVSRVTWRTIPGSGVDTRRFYPKNKRTVSGQKTFLYLGRLLVEKGISELFAAWEIAWRAGVRGELHIVGERPSDHPRAISERVWKRGLSLPGVKFHPPQQDVRPFLWNSHFVVLPSYREGLSMTLLEALATETPVITTLVPGCRQLVEGTDTGWGVAPRTIRPLADAIITASQTSYLEWRRMGQNGRQLVIDKYSASSVVAEYGVMIHDLTKS